MRVLYLIARRLYDTTNDSQDWYLVQLAEDLINDCAKAELVDKVQPATTELPTFDLARLVVLEQRATKGRATDDELCELEQLRGKHFPMTSNPKPLRQQTTTATNARGPLAEAICDATNGDGAWLRVTQATRNSWMHKADDVISRLARLGYCVTPIED